VAKEAKRQGCPTVSWTYNEPTVWYEFTLDAAREASAMGIHSIYVTNGYMSARALKDISPFLGAFRVDVKSFDDRFYQDVCGAELRHVLARAEQARRLGIHVEVVNLLIGGLNDDAGQVGAMAEWMVDKLGEDTPLHITRFHPDNRMLDRQPTPVSSLESAAGIARKAGLRYVYLGNVHGHHEEDTICPGCGDVLIKRSGFSASVKGLTPDNQCKKCGEPIPIKNSS
jgi:pyruvate formate lyase activating enzyme